MKPLPIKEQIKILKKVLYSPLIYGMCIDIAIISGHSYLDPKFSIEDLIPCFNHQAYLNFYSKVRTVQARQNRGFWDSPTIFGNLRRRWFIRHLIKELKKQL